jgi:antitoxin component YwqK of YwqJK toxin-antitoxin module
VKKFLALVFSVILIAACQPTRKVRLKELYTKVADEVMGNYAYDTSKGPSLELATKKTKESNVKKDRTKHRVFYGYKTRRAFVKTVKGNKKVEYETFFVLKKQLPLNPYVQDNHWFHKKKRKIFIGPIPKGEEKYAKILHGPYVRKEGRKILEEGIFYIGAKHGRWETYDKNFILLNKQRFYKGFPTDAEISYYDQQRKKPKEIVPIQLGIKEGNYYKFYEDGSIAMEGLYKQNVKVGVWIEFHPNKKKKREIQYAKDPFQDFKPYIIKEYDAKGKLIYDYRKDGERADSVNNFNF